MRNVLFARQSYTAVPLFEVWGAWLQNGYFCRHKKVITGENPFGFVFNNTRSQRLAISLTKNKIDLSFTIQLRAINWLEAVPGNTKICFAVQDGIAIGKTCSLYTIENFAGSS